MKQRNRKDTAVHHRGEARQLLQQGHSILILDLPSLDSLDRATQILQKAGSNLEHASDAAMATTSTTIILSSAATTVSKAINQLTQVHQDLEDAYREKESDLCPKAISTLLQRAANSARAETETAIKLLEEAGERSKPSFIPNGFRETTHNPAVRAIACMATVIAAGLAVYDLRVFALMATMGTLAAQQGTMIWAMLHSISMDGNKRQVDFHAIIAIGMTLALAASMTTWGLGPRAVIQITAITFILVLLEWGLSRALAAHAHPGQRGK